MSSFKKGLSCLCKASIAAGLTFIAAPFIPALAASTPLTAAFAAVAGGVTCLATAEPSAPAPVAA